MKQVTFRKIKVYYSYAEERFYRVLFVRKDMNLFELGNLLVAYLGGEYEHMWLWNDKIYAYEDFTWVEDSFDSEPVRDYEDYGLDDCILNSKRELHFTYDVGDNWQFNVRLYKKEIVKEYNDDDDIPMGILIDAKGTALWEDMHSSFYDYIILNLPMMEEDFAGFNDGAFKYYKDLAEHFDDPLDIDDYNKHCNEIFKKVNEDMKEFHINTKKESK